MAEWLRAGCLVQITAASLTGRFGKVAQRVSHELLRRNWVNFLATDAHDLTSRPPMLRDAYQLVSDKYGVETADRLCYTIPARPISARICRRNRNRKACIPSWTRSTPQVC